jgi:uncharacterized membrane protein HdeD (DUF308 family)
MKYFQIFVLIASIFVGMLVFGNDNYEAGFSKLFVGFIALAIGLVDVLDMFGSKEE